MNTRIVNNKWEGASFSKKTLIWANLAFIFIWLEYPIGLFDVYQIFYTLTGKFIPMDTSNIISYFAMAVSAILIFRKELIVELRECSNFWKNIMWAIVIYWIGDILSNGLSDILYSLNIEDVNQESIAASSMAFQTIGVCLLAPIAEELYFRFFLYNHFRKKSIFLALAITSILFAFWHTIDSVLYGDFTQLIMTMSYIPIGIAFALIYEKTGNIKYSILMHIINNTFATIMMFLY